MSDIALPANRQMRILEQLESNKSITVNQVVALCGVSAATARSLPRSRIVLSFMPPVCG